MALKSFRPLTPSLRFTTLNSQDDLSSKRPERALIEILPRTGGRNANGRVTSRHIGGRHKRYFRTIDWKRASRETATVIALEYDPNRTANIALLEYPDKTRTYIVAPVGLKAGATVVAGPDVAPDLGNALPLSKVPVGVELHNIELIPGRGAQIVRSAGSSATLMGLDGDYAQVKLPSGEIRKIHSTCYATIGQVGNQQHESISLGKAGRSRWLGRRPHVRGMVMNPVDHPNGGGQGKSKGGGGRQHLVSPWGQVAKGLKTRTKHKPTDRFIVQRRKK
jgi:large subunit ribosomal protein L2